jgi:hypothetical protein
MGAHDMTTIRHDSGTGSKRGLLRWIVPVTRRLPGVCVFLPFLALNCQPVCADSYAEQRARWERENYILTTRPHRLDAALRDPNVTDEEVREIQSASSEVLTKVIVNISGVTAGCRCEDGPQCTAQAWVTAFRNGRDEGLQLSMIGGRWVIGPVQRWWIRYDAFEPRNRKQSFREYQDAINQLFDAFPRCPIKVGKPAATSNPAAPASAAR